VKDDAGRRFATAIGGGFEATWGYANLSVTRMAR